MPWNCLCTTKEKRKLEISAPILNSEEPGSLQLVPLKQRALNGPAAGPYKFEERQKLVNHHSNASDTRLNGSNRPAAYGSLDHKTLKWKRGKKRSSNPAAGAAKGLNAASGNSKENGKIAKQLANVKFSFENSNSDAVDDARCICNGPGEDNSHGNVAVPAITDSDENVNKMDVERRDTGNYDEIPLSISEEPVKEGGAVGLYSDLGSSVTAPEDRYSDSIPFIDDDAAVGSQRLQKRQVENDHSVRFITLHPRNIGSPRTTRDQFRGEQTEKYLRLTRSHPPRQGHDEESFPLPPVEHDFQLWKAPKGRICQVCHDLLKLDSAVKCQSCELICHSWCASSMPSLRYHDTSFIIYRKWLKAQEELAFPTVFQYFSKIGSKSQNVEHHLTDTECNYSNDVNNSKSHEDDRKRNRRRTRSLEKTKQPEELSVTINNQDDQNNNALSHESIKLQIVESNTNSIRSNASSTKSQLDEDDKFNHVVVDVHRPSSEVLMIKENEFTKDEVPDYAKKNGNTAEDRSSRASDSSDRTITSEVSNKPAPLRKRYSHDACNPFISTSTADDPSDDNVDYAMVDLRQTAKISPMVDQRISRKGNNEDVEDTTISKSQSFPVKPKHQPQISDTLRLHYVTQRVLASVLPRRDQQDPAISRPHSEAQNGLQDKFEKEVISMLEQKHGKNYRVFDLESCISVITLERICELCKHIDKWLNSGQEKVVVLQDREDRQRLGIAIAAYLEYLDICASNFTTKNGVSSEDLRAQNTIARNWLALDVFSMKRFLEDFIGPLRIPSHKRYLHYFSGLLSGKIKMNSSALHLKYISIESPPSWLQYNRTSSQTDWSSFIKIYEGLRCIYTSDIHIIPITTRQFLYQIGNLRLRGDILIRCYQICPAENDYRRQTRELLFSMQFHTCAISSSEVIFTKGDLDYAFEDVRFPKDHKVSLHFSKGAVTENGYVFQSPLIRTEPPSELAKVDSIENFDLNSSYHTQGPLDGSLYATILKSPKTSEFPHQISNSTTVPRQREFVNQNVISPPPQFSNKHYEVVRNTPITQGGQVETRKREVSAPSTVRSHSQVKSDYNYVESRPGTSQSHYRDKYATTSGSSHYPQGSQQITIVKAYHHSGQNASNQNYQNGGREYVRSPLTLSMDSGISSSGPLNRPQPGSSVSPSSFPSQASPQEDRHRELDDILSDMLMTVQDIPDFSKPYSKQGAQKIVRSQSVIPTSGGYGLPGFSTSYDTVTRSHSYASHGHSLAQAGNCYLAKDRDLYDTSSTTTTLTPPPSESGRDTPTLGSYRSSTGAGSTSNISTLQHRQTAHREKREAILTSNNAQHDQRGIIMNLQAQSAVYPQPVRTDSVAASGASEDEDIPYHAREHSQPFTYGNVPPNCQLELESVSDPRMIKMQSGLSSPSLVRKTLDTSQTLRKTSPRNDFEEMLRERREKVMSEKYSISDRPSNFDKTTDRSYGDQKWATGTSQYNGYHYYNEPLKRSNTLEGFHRSNSTDGLSGQTWLQLQQQKLRAKKNQQLRDDRRYFEDVIHTEMRHRPLRSRAVVQRYDGYASDTAAFADEVDYRRPLHVQTPYNATRSPERNYHTITTTTTVTKERPFVAVKRAHEQARRDIVGSPPLSPLSILNASPNGHISQNQNTNGLLSMADSSRSGHVRLESDTMTNFQDDNNSLACTNSNTYNNINNNHSNNARNDTDHNHHSINFNYHQNEKNVYSLNNHDDDKNLASIAACGQLALDTLLASLAAETDLMNQQLAQSNGSNNNTETVETIAKCSGKDITKESHTKCEMQERKNFNKLNGDAVSINNNSTTNRNNPNLMEVIADLVDYTYGGLRQMKLSNDCCDSISNNSNSNSSSNGLPRQLNSEQENSSSISPSLSERSNIALWNDQAREESFSSYRSETDAELSIAGSPRPETPGFPVTPRTPFSLSSNGNVSPALPPKSPTSQRKDLYTGAHKGNLHEVVNQNETISCYTSRRNSNASNANSEPQEVAAHHVKFVRDSSKYWYKPNISREEAVALLRNATPGTFIVRDSTTFKNAFGLVVRVAHPPPGVQAKGPGSDELVRHFLVEPTSRGVRLKGCANEPVFTSLSALVYQHSITPLALPCRLIIPDRDIQAVELHSVEQKQLLTQGAACNVLYLYACGTESLTGEEAVRKAVSELYASKPLPTPTEVHFKVSQQGITLTDNSRQKFFRKHYSANIISFCGLDPEKRLWSIRAPEGEIPVNNKIIFAFVARRSASSSDNQCHVFCDLQPNQPALAIVSFANKVLPTEKIVNQHI